MEEKTVQHGKSVQSFDPPDSGTGPGGKGPSFEVEAEGSDASEPVSFDPDPPDGSGSGGKTAGYSIGDSDS